VIACILACFSLQSQPKVDALIKFQKTEHSFGKVKQNKPVTITFPFTNISSGMIYIEDATAECGCTKPTFPMQPISGGKGGEIKVTYDAANLGSFTKKVTVKLVNVAESKILTIKGEVVK
jgi:hypothetical protein